MRNKWVTIISLLIFTLSTGYIWADELDDLTELSDDNNAEETVDQSDDLSSLEFENENGLETEDEISYSADDSDEEGDSDSEPTFSVGGYIKLLGYWSQEKYSDQFWSMYQNYPTRPAKQELSGYNNSGTRLQLKIEGFLGEKARLFSAFNINYNNSSSLHDTTLKPSSKTRQNAEIRMVESFVEIYDNSRVWKIGPQLVTWSYIEGMEVPTDRVNARDQSYKSTEYEDGKLPSAGILMTQNIGDSQLEVMMIPVAKTNVSQEFLDYIYPGAEESIENKPNQAKWATRFSSTVGKLDYAISYVEGIDPIADLNATMNGKAYNRIKSPGLDLQYNLGSWLAKLSWVQTLTEDEDGDSRTIKNSWSKYVIGGEFSVSGSTINIYAGQHLIDDFKTDALSQNTNFLLGQVRERTDFISGHLNASFLTGDALNLVLMAANYWDEDGKAVQSIIMGTFKYKIANGLEVLVSPSYMDMMENEFTDLKTEIKYSF